MLRIPACLAMFALMSTSAFADEISTADIYACKAMDDDAARLACYDEAVGRLEGAEAAGEIAVVTSADVQEAKRSSFGLSMPTLPSFGLSGGEDELTEIALPVVSVTGEAGSLRVELENGQIWKQTDSRPFTIREAEEAVIKKGALGSYKMKLDGKRAFKVERIK